MLYAIGEIALVVIGILIALQINTWNQERLDRREENRIYKAIEEKMDLNRFQLETGKERHNKVIESAKRLLKVNKSSTFDPTIEQNAMDLHTITKRFLFGKSNKTNIYDELIASGQMNLLRSDELRESLTFIKVQMELLESYEELQNRFVDSELSPFLNKHTDRLGIYTNVAQVDTSDLDHLYQVQLHKVDERSIVDYYDPNLFENREFSNLLYELIKQTSKLLPIYNRIEHEINKIDSIVMKP